MWQAKQTLAPKRQPPLPPRPPSDGRAGNEQWDYSWNLVVPVGSAPGEWPRDSALELAQETFYSAIEDDAGRHAEVQEQLMRQLESLLEPCSAQDAEWWARMRNSYDFEPDDGSLLGDSRLNERYLLYFYFRDGPGRVTHDNWDPANQAGRRNVTSVSIRYRGPARFRLRHPGGQQFIDVIEHRLRPNQVSPVFGF
jgi:hypothetical protein